MKSSEEKSPLAEALQVLHTPMKRVLLFGLLTNLLVLMPTWYMLEVYGRVLDSRNINTLLMLTLLVLGAYVVLEVLEWVRSTLLQQAAQRLETTLAPRLFEAQFRARLKRPTGAQPQALSDLATLRNFIASPAMTALLDAPFALLILVLIWLINPLLGGLSILVAFLLFLTGALTERGTRQPLAEANQFSREALHHANGVMRNAQAIEAMGMMDAVFQRWNQKQEKFLERQAVASDHAGLGSAGTKLIQTLQGSLLLGLGCWLTLQGQLDAAGSMMIVASVLGTRALAPMVMAIGQWRQVVQARQAHARLDAFMRDLPKPIPAMPLPPPQGVLTVDNLSATAPGTQFSLLRGVNFRLRPGETLAIVGPSGAGKTTLARLLVGLWPAATGKVRLDGVDVYTWNKSELGAHVGYLPQDIELFDGTVAENIARFADTDPLRLEAAAQAVGLHEHILGLPNGYDTRIGVDGATLSGGQRQRLALARALYGDPRYLVLDEPNSNLDEAGEAALLKVLAALKARGATVIVITHRTSVLAACDKLMILRDGQMQAFGPRDEVLQALKKAMEAARQGVQVAPRGGA